MSDVDEVVAEFSDWARGQGVVGPRAEVRVESLEIPHSPTTLRDGWQGVYSFKYQGVWLKVGKAGPKSGARWTSQHYHHGRALSTLAFSLICYARFSDVEFSALSGLKEQLQAVGADDIGDWIKNNTDRVNFLIRFELGRSGLDTLEGIAHRILKPLFEGSWDPQLWKTISRLTATGSHGE